MAFRVKVLDTLAAFFYTVKVKCLTASRGRSMENPSPARVLTVFSNATWTGNLWKKERAWPFSSIFTVTF